MTSVQKPSAGCMQSSSYLVECCLTGKIGQLHEANGWRRGCPSNAETGRLDHGQSAQVRCGVCLCTSVAQAMLQKAALQRSSAAACLSFSHGAVLRPMLLLHTRAWLDHVSTNIGVSHLLHVSKSKTGTLARRPHCNLIHLRALRRMLRCASGVLPQILEA